MTKDTSRFSLLPVLVVAISMGLTGCYTQLSTVDQQRTAQVPQAEASQAEQSVEVAENTTAVEDPLAVAADYTVSQSVVDVPGTWASNHADITYARYLYEARARGDISFRQYRDGLLDLHYADPYRFNMSSALFYDPLWSPMIPRARFSAIIIHGNRYGWTPFDYHYGYSPHYIRSVYRPGLHLSIHNHFYYPPSRFRYSYPRYAFVTYPRHYRGPFGIQRGSTFGAQSSTIGHGRVGTTGRVVSSQPASARGDRVGTIGRTPALDQSTAREAVRSSGDAGANGRVGTVGRVVSRDSDRSRTGVERSRIPQRLEVPERSVPQTRGTTTRSTTQRSRGTTTTSRDRGSRTTRDRGSRTTRNRGSRTSSGSSSSTSRDRGSSTSRGSSSGSSSRGSSSRRGGNNDDS